MDVVLDVDPPALRSLTVDGKLSFSDDLDIGLETEWIYLRGGELQIGSEASPYTRKATITLTDTVPDEDINTMGDRGIMLMRGTLSLHGDREHTWTKLARTAEAGSTRIEVLDASGWRAGRRDRPRLDRLRSPAGGEAHHRRHPRQRDHARSRRSNTCTSARSPSASTSAAKSAC